MHNLNIRIQNIVAMITVVLISLVGISPVLAHAQVEDPGCCSDSYDSSYTPDYNSSYTPDYNSSYTPDYNSSYTPDYNSSYTPDYNSSYTPDYNSSYTPDYNSSYTPDYTTGPSIDENGVTYTQLSYPSTVTTSDYSYSTPLSVSAPGFGSYGIGGYSTGGYSYGSYGYSTPMIASAPIAANIPSSYQQQSQPSVVTNNTCTNYSCNTVTSVSNSGNTTISNSGNTATIVPVAAAPVTYTAQYTFPQTYSYQNVSCSISASPNSIQAGQYTYLTWQSYGATNAILTNYGNVAPDGSLSIQPYGSTEYVLTVYGYNGQTATCNAYVNVGNNYSSVTLSQIPYTGFDLGTFGDSMYFALLAAFALAAGYLLVYYRGGMGAFALAMVPARKTSYVSAVKMEKKTASAPVIEENKEVVVATAPAKAASLNSLPAFASIRPTSDSMVIASKDGAPRIVINRN